MNGQCSSNMQNAGAEGRVYLLQVDGSSDLAETQAIPLHMLISNLSRENEQLLLPVLQGKAQEGLQLYIDSSEANTLFNYNQTQVYNEIIAGPPQNYDSLNSLADNTNDMITSQTFLQNESAYNIEHNNTPAPDLQETNRNAKVKYKKTNVKVKPKVSYVHIPDQPVVPRAIASLPASLQRRRDIVSSRRTLPPYTKFGPVRGVESQISHTEAQELAANAAATNTPIFLMNRTKDHVTHIDVSDIDKSNWLSLVPLGEARTCNLCLYEEDGEVFCVSTRSVCARAPLLLGYSATYHQRYGLPAELPTMELDEDEGSVESPSKSPRIPVSAGMQRQVRQRDKRPRRHKYRCKHCTSTFSRIFTLRRHMAQHCGKKTNVLESPEKQAPVSQEPQLDEHRLPSDESFQNYSNGLDFSTNLFDTDRMPSLDISGSSRSDEFNPYAVSDKDYSALNDLGFKFTSADNNYQNEKKPQSPETLLISCRHCNKTIVKGEKRKHMKQCTGRHFECECGSVYTHKEKFVEHLYTAHSSTINNQEKPKESDDAYKCDQCQHVFKRRGMLVNHVWRSHGRRVSGGTVTRERLFPCPEPACRKLYRSAAKRRLHLTAHHPGVSAWGPGLAVVRGRTVARTQAHCWACPKQYATRAKLLQHARKHHPHLAPPPRKRAAKSEPNDAVPEAATPNPNHIPPLNEYF